MGTQKKTQKKTTNNNRKTTAGKNGRQIPAIKDDKTLRRKKHKQLKHDSDRNPYRFVWVSLILLFIAITLAIAEISYLQYWKFDVSSINSPLGYKFDDNIKNSCGHLGVLVSDLLIRKMFGLSALLIPIICFIYSLAFINIRYSNIRRISFPVVILTCLSSVFLGCFDGRNEAFFGSGLGGEMGIYVSEWLGKYLGGEGSKVLLIVLALTFIWIFFSNICISIAKLIIGAITYIAKKLFSKKYISPVVTITEKATAQEEEEEEDEEDDDDDEKHDDSSNLITASGAIIDNEKENDDTTENEESEDDDSYESDENEEEDEDVDEDEDEEVDNKRNEPLPETILMENGRLGAKITDDYIIYFCPELLPTKETTVTEKQKEEKKEKKEEKKEEEEVIFTIKQPGNTENSGSETKENAKETVESNQDKTEVKTEPVPVAENRDTQTEEVSETEQSNDSQNEDNTEEATNTENSDSKTEVNTTENPSTNENEDEMFIKTHTDEKEDNNSNTIKIDDLIISQRETEEEVTDDDVNERKLYDPTAELSYYKKPTIDLLRKYDESNNLVSAEEVVKNKEQIVNTLGTFGIKISEIEATVGPTVTLYEIKPAPGVRISKIQNLEKDIALALAALGIRIIAPIPGKGAIGIEVPNKKKATVSMYSVIKSAKFHESTAELPIALGRTIQNETLVLDLAKMPHLLVAGATGQGKSVGLNAIITSLLYKKHPAELKFIMVDPKRLELTPYSLLAKHFMAQMEGSDDIILTDTNKVVYTLNSICREMDDRYKLLEDAGVKNLKEYNDKFIHRKLNPEKGHRFLPYLVVIVDEFADLIMTAGREIETPIARIAQLARAAGIHMIIATQRPTTNIITGTIKANFPARIAFRVTSYMDSRTILDRAGADQLIGRGDMLVYHGSDLTRVQCAFVDTPEVEAITKFIGAQQGYYEPYQLPEFQPEDDKGSSSSGGNGEHQSGPMDPLLIEVARYVVDNQIGSTSKIQRNFEIGFNRAGRIVDQLEKIGIVGKQQGSKPRQVLVNDPVYLEHILETINR